MPGGSIHVPATIVDSVIVGVESLRIDRASNNPDSHSVAI